MNKSHTDRMERCWTFLFNSKYLRMRCKFCNLAILRLESILFYSPLLFTLNFDDVACMRWLVVCHFWSWFLILISDADIKGKDWSLVPWELLILQITRGSLMLCTVDKLIVEVERILDSRSSVLKTEAGKWASFVHVCTLLLMLCKILQSS